MTTAQGNLGCKYFWEKVRQTENVTKTKDELICGSTDLFKIIQFIQFVCEGY